MPSRPHTLLCRCVPLLAALCATLAIAANAQASSTTTTLPPQSVTTTSSTYVGQGTCNAGTICRGYFSWKQTGGAWYRTPQASHPCSSSSACTWSQSVPLTGLLPGTSYVYVLCSADGSWTYLCYGPDGTTTTRQSFTTVWLPPANLSPPTVSGTATEYYALSVSRGSWTSRPTSYVYQWQDCDGNGANCVNIAGATAPSYIVGAGDVGHAIVVQDTASNSGGTSAPATSAPTAVVSSSSVMSTAGGLTFNGNFENSITPWKTGGGGAQCANYGTPSNSPRLRGNFTFVSSPAGQGASSGQFSLPADTNTTTYPLEACDLVTAHQPLNLGADQYYGIMVYVPAGWTIPAASASNSWWGVTIKEFHYQNIWGAPIEFELHPDHVTVALETGGCNSMTTSSPGCQYRSNADTSFCPSSSTVTCLPHYYAIPPGALVQGAWNEIVMHVHWAADNTGEFQTWYRTAGSPTWTQSSSMNGSPTVQWDHTTGCCYASYVDITGAYTGAVTAPLSLWLDNDVIGDGFGAVANAMP